MKFGKNKLKLTFALFLFGLVFLFAQASHAATNFVGTQPEDGIGTSGDPHNFPWLQAFVGVGGSASSGDIVILKDSSYSADDYITVGGYAYTLYVGTSGSDGSPITIESESLNGAILDDDNYSDVGIGIGIAPGVHDIAINKLGIRDFAVAGISGVSGSPISNISISQNIIGSIGYFEVEEDDPDPAVRKIGISVPAEADNFSIDSNTVHDIGRHYEDWDTDNAISLLGHDHVVTNNLFYNDQAGWMIDISDDGSVTGAKDILVANNTFSGVAATGSGSVGQINVDPNGNGQIEDLVISSNISSDGSVEAFVNWSSNAYSVSSVVIRNNLTSSDDIDYNAPAAGVTYPDNVDSADSASFFANASGEFSSPPTDYRLKAGSPAISLANSLDAPALDFGQVARPIGAADDAGIYEYAGESDLPTFTVNTTVDAGPVKTDTVKVTVNDASAITVSKYGFSANNTCDGDDTYGTDFTSGSDFSIAGDHTDYLCVMATDEYTNTGYGLVGQLNTDNTAPILSFSDDVAAGPATSDTVTGSWGNAAVLKWDYDADGSCSETAGDYTKTDADSMDQAAQTNNTKYICLYGADAAGNYATQASANDINIDITAPTISFSEDVAAGPVQADTITASWGDASVKKWDYDDDGTCSETAGDYTKTDANSMDQSDATNNTKFICLYAADALGNYDTLASANDINIDIIAPNVNITDPLSGTVSGIDTISFTNDDPASAQCSPDDSHWTACISASTTLAGLTGWSAIVPGATFTLYLRATDAAGNTGTDSVADLTREDLSESDDPTFTVNLDTDAGPVKTDTINITVNDASAITVSEYGFSADITCDGDDTYGNAFTSGSDFAIADNHTDYLCVMATDEYSNTGYETVGQLNTDNTAPTLSFSDDVAAGPATSDTVTGSWGDASVKKWDYDADGTCSAVAGDYTKTDANSMDQSDATNNTKYICLYGADVAGNYATQASANDINIDVTAPTLSFSDDVAAGPVQSDTVTASWGGAITMKWDYDADGTCSTVSGDYTKTDEDSMDQSDATNNTKFICLYAADALGNYVTLASANDINIDVTDPVLTSISITDTSDYTNDATPDIALVSSGSPTFAAFSCDAGSHWSSWIAYASTISSFNITNGATGCSATNENKTITAKIKDAADNESATTNDSTHYDNTAPAGGSFSINSGDATTDAADVTLDVTCPTDTWSTVQMAYGNTAAPANWTSCAASQAHTLSAGDGTKTVYMRFQDGGQNTTSDVTDTIELDTAVPEEPEEEPTDTTAPWTTADPEGGTYNAAQTVALTCEDEDGGSGCDKIYYTTDGTDPDTGSTQYGSPIEIASSATLKFFSKDQAGNSEDFNTETYVIDPGATEIFSAPRPELTLGHDKFDVKPKKTYWSSSKTFEFEGRTEGLAEGIVRVYNGSRKMKTVSIAASGKWRAKIHVGNERLYKISFRYYSASGELMEKTSEYKIRVDKSKPKFVNFPTNLTKRSGEKIWWDVKDSDDIKYFRYILDGKIHKTTREHFFLPANLRRGYHTLRIQAYDKAGNKASRKVQLMVR